MLDMDMTPHLSSSSTLTILKSSGRSHSDAVHGSFSSGMGDCCPPVFDPSTLFALIAGIALATYFLRPVCLHTLSLSFIFVFVFETSAPCLWSAVFVFAIAFVSFAKECICWKCYIVEWILRLLLLDPVTSHASGFLPNFTTCLPTSHNHLLANNPYHGSSLNESAMSDISLFSASSPLSLFSPLLSTATARSHQGPHGGFSSGFGGCCPPVFNPGTLFALISGIALATYFLRPVYCSVCLLYSWTQEIWLWTENVNTKVGDCSDHVRGEGFSGPMGTLCTKW